MDFCLRIWRVFRFVHLVYFLRGGVMRTIPEWLLGIEIVSVNPKAERAISFELMNRLVIWAAVGQALTKGLTLAVSFSSTLGQSNISRYLNMESYLNPLAQLLAYFWISEDSFTLKKAIALEHCSVCKESHMSQPFVYLNKFQLMTARVKLAKK